MKDSLLLGLFPLRAALSEKVFLSSSQVRLMHFLRWCGRKKTRRNVIILTHSFLKGYYSYLMQSGLHCHYERDHCPWSLNCEHSEDSMPDNQQSLIVWWQTAARDHVKAVRNAGPSLFLLSSILCAPHFTLHYKKKVIFTLWGENSIWGVCPSFVYHFLSKWLLFILKPPSMRPQLCDFLWNKFWRIVLLNHQNTTLPVGRAAVGPF